MAEYCVKPLRLGEFSVEVPASKSILNRALVLSAFTEGDILLRCGNFAEDTRTLLACLEALGISVERLPVGLLAHGTRNIKRNAKIDVRDSGTSARFLTAILAFFGGDYEITASKQMQGRPMEVVSILEQCGVSFEFYGKKGRLPFRMRSDGVTVEGLACDTGVSTQFASGLLLAAAVRDKPFALTLSGAGMNSSYIKMTETLIGAFGGSCKRALEKLEVTPIAKKPQTFSVEPDVSAACYFFALALLCRAKVTVRGVSRESLQGDIRFLDLLERRGADIFQSAEGLTADGTKTENYSGFTEDIGDFADQAPTIAALAPFADSPTRLSGLGRLRYKESDRISAILRNLRRLGVACRADGGNLYIPPTPPRGSFILPYGDHRIAMAFALIGLKTGNITIRDPECCKKTFENYFGILDRITGK